MHHSEETAGRFFVAGGQASKLLEPTEKALGLVAVALQVAVDEANDCAVLFAGNDDLRAQGLDGRRHGVCIAGFVGQHVARARGRGQQVRWQSACWPGPSTMRNGLPSASTSTCTLVLSPPRLRPGASSPTRLFFGCPPLARGPAPRGIAHHPIHIGLLHRLEQALPSPFLGPAPAALAQRVVLAEAGGQRPPGAAVASHPENGIQKEPVIGPGTPNVACFAR